LFSPQLTALRARGITKIIHSICKKIITAVDCSGRPSYVLLGDIRLKTDLAGGSVRREIVKIAEFIVHPAYRKPLTYNDIALIRLDRKVALSRSVLPACLPQPRFRLEQKTNTLACGWGQTGTAGKELHF
jgi:hypothetical protein